MKKIELIRYKRYQTKTTEGEFLYELKHHMNSLPKYSESIFTDDIENLHNEYFLIKKGVGFSGMNSSESPNEANLK